MQGQSLRIVPCQEAPVTLPPECDLEKVTAFLSEDGDLGLSDGTSIWVSCWIPNSKSTHLRAGNAVSLLEVATKPRLMFSIPPVGDLTWASIPSPGGDWLEGPPGTNGLIPLAFPPDKASATYSLRSARQGSYTLALIVEGNKARAMLWKLDPRFPTDVQPPDGFHFTGETLRVPFAKTWDSKHTVHADLFGIRDSHGLWSTAYRLSLGGRLCSLQKANPGGESTPQILFTFGQGVPQGRLPFPIDPKGPTGGEWTYEYVESSGYITVNALDRFVLDFPTARGTYFHNPWEEH